MLANLLTQDESCQVHCVTIRSIACMHSFHLNLRIHSIKSGTYVDGLEMAYFDRFRPQACLYTSVRYDISVIGFSRQAMQTKSLRAVLSLARPGL